MAAFGGFRARETRPQFVVLLLVMLFVGLPAMASGPGGWLFSSARNVIQPARTRTVQPVRISPLPRVLAATITRYPNGIDCLRIACLALTFDDGPNPITTPQILQELEQAQVPATFFVVGSRATTNPALLRRMHVDGDEIGNHSWSHPDFTTLSAAQIKQQIQLTQQAVMNAGVPPPTLFRPPYGAVNPAVEKNLPLTTLLWNEDPKDWQAQTPQQVIQAVEASAKAGGIIDMHDIYHVSADALPRILTDLQARGLHFVTVSQLLNLTPASRGIYYGHP